jgi:hypothetical protein
LGTRHRTKKNKAINTTQKTKKMCSKNNFKRKPNGLSRIAKM